MQGACKGVFSFQGRIRRLDHNNQLDTKVLGLVLVCRNCRRHHAKETTSKL